VNESREERDYHRKVAQFARANAKTVSVRRAGAIKSGLSNSLHSGSQPMKMFNAEFKRRRLAGLTGLRYGAAKRRFESLLAKCLVEGLRNGDLRAVIETALTPLG
jgi:hypothetical protein